MYSDGNPQITWSTELKLCHIVNHKHHTLPHCGKLQEWGGGTWEPGVSLQLTEEKRLVTLSAESDPYKFHKRTEEKDSQVLKI